MRKNKLLLLLALLLTAATGAWAEEQVVYTLDGTVTNSHAQYTDEGVMTQDGITWYVTGNTNMNPWRIGGKSLSGVDRSVWSESALGGTVTKVTLEFGTASSITVNSITMTVAGDADFSNVIDTKAVTFSANNTVDVTPTEGKEWKNAYYRFVFNVTVEGSSNKFLQLKSIKFYNDPDAQQQGGGAATTYTVTMKDGVKDADKWTVKVGEGQAQALPIGGLKGDGKETVTLQYTGRLKVKGVTATSDAAPAAGKTVDLSTLTADYEAKDGETLTGNLASNVKISIADGATVKLKDATINGGDNYSYKWAGLNCAGDATITLEGTNTVKGFYNAYPGIQVPMDKTLTIQGTGSLNARSNGYAAGIGGGYQIACGNITISGGTVEATGGDLAAGIGGGNRASCGNITINGGTVEATGGSNAAGIGGGSKNGACGTITITSGVTSVTATKGANAPYSIGKGNGGQDITVNIGGVEGAITDSPYTYEPTAQAKPAATVTTAPKGAEIVGVGKNTALVSGGVADGGTLMYAVTTTNTKPASTDGFSADVPTAKDITASGTVYVWYYVKGDDTHSDSEIAATAIEVPVADIVWDATNVSDLSVSGNSEPYEKEGVTLSCNANQISAAWYNYGDPTKDGISFNTRETGGFTFTAPTGKAFAKIEMKANGPGGWSNANLGTGWAFNNTTVTWTGSASTVDLLTGANKFNKGTYISYIAFYLSE